PVPPPVPLAPDPVPLAPPPVPTFYTLVEDPVPHGSLPRRSGLYTLADDDVPLGKLPKTSGNGGTAAGSVGVLSLLAGAVLGLFGKKKKKDEE
ncbi:MAG: LPXTG cell wall anchor domain-containing protein, partial [Oscillospiraceae bacterium]|nr:LPXTG cell wall anchor domain-containing protein [Oscillospiraceae bacterium]